MMTEDGRAESEVYEFVIQEIESVPHLEALLLLYNSRPREWSTAEVAKRLYVDTKIAQVLLLNLMGRKLLAPLPGKPETYRYEPRSEQTSRLIASLDQIYRRQVVRISTIIHSKASPAVRDFARAFRITKEGE